LGIVIVAGADPLAGTGLGVIEPVRIGPVVALSSRHVTVLPVTNDAIVPFRVPGRLVSVVEPVRVSDGAATVALRL
jgi:hypothetical protein